MRRRTTIVLAALALLWLLSRRSAEMGPAPIPPSETRALAASAAPPLLPAAAAGPASAATSLEPAGDDSAGAAVRDPKKAWVVAVDESGRPFDAADVRVYDLFLT